MESGSLAPSSSTGTTTSRGRMFCVDTSSNRRLPILMEMIAGISRATEPNEVYRRFARGIRELQGPDGYIAISTRGLKPGEYKITREMIDGRAPEETGDPWRHWDRLPVHRGGFLGEIIRQAYPELIYHLDVRTDPVLGERLAPYKSMMAMPLFDNGEPVNWSIVLSKRPEGFTVEELEESLLRANLIGGMTKNTVISKQLREANQRINRQFEQIASIQKALLPDAMPEIPGVSFAAKYTTSEKAGGDYYDFIPLDKHADGTVKKDGRWAIVIADVSGHGASAAVVMAMLHTMLHAYPGPHDSPGRILEFANQHLCAKRLEASFVTAFCAVFDPATRRVVYARAGHNPPLLKNAGSGGAVKRLDDVGGLPLGIDAAVEYDDTSFLLEPGQTLVFYTDGITEAMDEAEDMFGVEGIESALTVCSGEPACVLDSITGALAEHTHRAKNMDDQTLVAMKLQLT